MRLKGNNYYSVLCFTCNTMITRNAIFEFSIFCETYSVRESSGIK